MKQIKYDPKSCTYILKDKFTGKILWDEESGLVAIQIDDKILTLGEFGKALLVYEGWDFRVEFID